MLGHKINEYDYDDGCAVLKFIETLTLLGIASKYDIDCATIFRDQRKTVWEAPGDQFTG